MARTPLARKRATMMVNSIRTCDMAEEEHHTFNIRHPTSNIQWPAADGPPRSHGSDPGVRAADLPRELSAFPCGVQFRVFGLDERHERGATGDRKFLEDGVELVLDGRHALGELL